MKPLCENGIQINWISYKNLFKQCCICNQGYKEHYIYGLRKRMTLLRVQFTSKLLCQYDKTP